VEDVPRMFTPIVINGNVDGVNKSARDPFACLSKRPRQVLDLTQRGLTRAAGGEALAQANDDLTTPARRSFLVSSGDGTQTATRPADDARQHARARRYRSGRSPDWINVKNPDAPAATRVIEG
jgi:hypothetical protein